MPAEADRHQLEIDRLHQGMVVELDRRFKPRGELAGAATRSRNDHAVDEEVASTISVIRQVASAIGEQQGTIRHQEELIYEQRAALAEFQRQKQAAYAELAEAERTAKGERDRADRAESRLQSSEAQIKRLEDYSASLKSHLNSLMAVVRDSLAVDEISSSSRAD